MVLVALIVDDERCKQRGCRCHWVGGNIITLEADKSSLTHINQAISVLNCKMAGMTRSRTVPSSANDGRRHAAGWRHPPPLSLASLRLKTGTSPPIISTLLLPLRNDDDDDSLAS